MSLATTVKESKLQRRMYTQQALMYRQKGDREGIRVFLNAAKTEVLNQRYFLGPCPFWEQSYEQRILRKTGSYSGESERAKESVQLIRQI